MSTTEQPETFQGLQTQRFVYLHYTIITITKVQYCAVYYNMNSLARSHSNIIY